MKPKLKTLKQFLVERLDEDNVVVEDVLVGAMTWTEARGLAVALAPSRGSWPTDPLDRAIRCSQVRP